LLEDDLIEQERVWGAFGAEKGPAREAARNFIQIVADRGGLLEREDNRYGFYTHRTFREFLAGRYLAEELSQNWGGELAQRYLDTNWREALLLAAGYLAINGESRANAFVRQLAQLGAVPTERAQALTLAGQAWADLPLEAHTPLDPLRLETQQWLTPQLLQELTTNPPEISAPQRRALGLALAALGDPRFTAIAPAWCPIPAGPAHLGTTAEDIEQLKQSNIDWNEIAWFKNEQPAHTVTLAEYWLGKYPVTNAEYARFMTAKGYEQDKYWSQTGWQWRQGKYEADLSVYGDKDLRKNIEDWLKRRPVEKRHQPFYWDDLQWNAANLPVVGVTWFEAEAYANWLTEQLKDKLPAGWRVRLPTEAEWERAARRAKDEGGRLKEDALWPWGNAWDNECCNSEESKLNATSPVGMYPHGATADGVEDLIGNVWEWCWDGWDSGAYKNRDGQTDPFTAQNSTRILRGGAFLTDRGDCRAADRVRFIPVNFNQLFGFRVCASPILHSEL
jgi:formylglycine-generating enzyme required for sulfatase activity